MNELSGRKIGELTVEEYADVVTHCNSDIYDKIVKLNQDVTKLQEENVKILKELEEYKQKTLTLERDLMMVDKRQKRNNVIFKGLNEDASPKTVIEGVCSQVLEVPNIVVKETRKTFNRDGKMNVIAELESENMVNDLLRNSSKLKGSEISLDRDLTRDAREKKSAMLKIKKELNGMDSSKKIVVRDDRMKVENRWFYWSGEKKLMCGSEDGKVVLSNLFGNNVNILDLSYKSVLDRNIRK